MPKDINAILIDPFACEVREVQISAADVLHDYYALLSHESMQVNLVTTAVPGILKGRDALFVDDEGLDKDPQRYFHMATSHQPFAGKGLIVGADKRGKADDAVTSIDLVRAVTVFAEPIAGQLVVTRRPWVKPSQP